MISIYICRYFFFFFNDTATTEIYTLSLHDALPILSSVCLLDALSFQPSLIIGDEEMDGSLILFDTREPSDRRSEEHTSELQSRQYLVCRLLLEKKKNKQLIMIN